MSVTEPDRIGDDVVNSGEPSGLSVSFELQFSMYVTQRRRRVKQRLLKLCSASRPARPTRGIPAEPRFRRGALKKEEQAARWRLVDD